MLVGPVNIFIFEKSYMSCTGKTSVTQWDELLHIITAASSICFAMGVRSLCWALSLSSLHPHHPHGHKWLWFADSVCVWGCQPLPSWTTPEGKLEHKRLQSLALTEALNQWHPAQGWQHTQLWHPADKGRNHIYRHTYLQTPPSVLVIRTHCKWRGRFLLAACFIVRQQSRDHSLDHRMRGLNIDYFSIHLSSASALPSTLPYSLRRMHVVRSH